ncbi:uncharacterized protein LOC132755327 isoform X2 [Ruditapes philippinarum]|nr:uncharacterized protein LOC132755327 isoform X2 [Ruditapes philippinarum]
MLSGRTSVFIDTRKSDDDGDLVKTDDDIASKTVTEGDDVMSEDSHESHQEVKKKKSLDRSKYGKFIIHFDAGKSFGEIALISEDSVRNATVIADEETDLMLIHRDLFNRSMKAQQEKEYEEKKSFIDNCRLFGDWTPKFKHLLEMSIRKEVYPYGTQIMRQGDPAGGLFFIVSGQAKVTTEPSRHKSQYPQLMTQMSVMEQEFGRQNKENVSQKLPNGLTQHQIRVRRKEGYAAAEKRFMSKSLELCCVEGNEIQGDLEMAMEMPTSSCTVTCTAMNTTVFILDTKTYERLILKKNLHTILKLKEGVFRKLNSRIATSNGGNVPLFRKVCDKLQEELKPKMKEQQTQKVKNDNDRNVVLSQMIKLYLKDRGPLIDPILPDSFHNRLMSEKRNKQIEKSEKKKEEQALILRRRKTRIPRSRKQLQNSAAETELLHPEQSWLEQAKPSKTRHLRPKTALGIESHSQFEDGSERPHTSPAEQSNVFHLTECETTDELGETIVKEKSIMVTQEYDHVFKQIDTIQRGKDIARSKVICSVAAKNELREETERAQLNYRPDDMYDLHDEDYFDYETSASNLKNLEDRMKVFCDEVRHKRVNDHVRIDEMKCYHVKDSDNVPMSGGTVFVNRKPCSYPKNIRLSKDVHQHVRRYIITRDQNRYTTSASALAIRSKSSLGFASNRPKSAW